MKCCVSPDVGTWTNWLTFEPIQIIVRIQGPDLHRIFAFQRVIWKSYEHIWRSCGRISMKLNGSMATGAWTNWLGFELDPDHSTDPRTGFTPDFWISAGFKMVLLTEPSDNLCRRYMRSTELVPFWFKSQSYSNIYCVVFVDDDGRDEHHQAVC